MGLWDQRKLIHLAILKLLVPDVSADRLLVPAHRRNEIAARPELVSGEVLRFSLEILRDPNRAFSLALDEADHLGDRVFWWDRNQHVHMIGHQMALLNPAFPPSGQVVEHDAKLLVVPAGAHLAPADA